jgi:hypothetical protein
MPRIRFTVRRLMLAVAVVAIIMPFSEYSICLIMGTVIAIWTPLVLVTLTVCNFVKRTTGVVVLIGLAVAATSFLMLGPFDHRLLSDAFGPIIVGLTPLNLIGPFYAAWRRLRFGSSLAAGHVIWAWLGVAWLVIFWDWQARPSASIFEPMVDCSRLSVVLTVMLGLYGKRPEQTGAAWAHYAGWVLMECDAVVWGWYACGFLKWF